MAGEFYISPSNPNAEQGGGDLCNPHKQVEDVRGPWVVFPAVDVAEAQGQLPLPHAALPISRIKQILIEASGVAADDTGGQGDIRDKIAVKAVVDTDFTELPAEYRAGLRAAFPAGGVTRTPFGVVDVPGEDAPASPNPTSQVEDLLPTLEPDAQGTYSPPVGEEEEAPAI